VPAIGEISATTRHGHGVGAQFVLDARRNVHRTWLRVDPARAFTDISTIMTREQRAGA